MTIPQSREQRRREQRIINKVSRSFGDKLVEIDIRQWPALVDGRTPKGEGMLRVFRSKHVLVQEYAPPPQDADMVVCRLTVNLIDLDGDRWTDGIGWDQLQKIKNDLGYAAFDAVEVYPRDSDVVNVANFRHVWVLRGLIPFAWRKSLAGLV